jgi:hypothetical protein
VNLVPSGVPVAVSNQLGGRLSGRRYVYSFPWVRQRAQWIVVDRNDLSYPDLARYKRQIRSYRADEKWRTVYSSHGVTVLHRRSTAGR